jgi:hypothetical protein
MLTPRTSRKDPAVANQLCIHCREFHPAGTPFCSNTGKPLPPLGASTAAAGAPAADSMSSTSPASPTSPMSPTSPPPFAPPVSPVSPGSSLAGVEASPPAGGAPAPGLGGDGEKGVWDLLQQAFALYRKHAKLLISVAAVVFVPGAVAHACATAAILAPTMAVSVGLDPVTHLPVGDPFASGTVVAGFAAVLLGLLAVAVTGLFLHGIIVPLAQGAMAVALADRIAGGNAGWREIWTWLSRRIGTVLSAVIPAAILTGVGFFFLVVPGLILAFFFSFVPTIALFEGVGGTAALRRSFELVRSDWLRMLLMLIAFAVISALAQFVAGMLSMGLFGTRLVRDLVTLLAMPIPVLGSVLLYFDVRRKHDPGGFDERQLAHEMQALRGGGPRPRG